MAAKEFKKKEEKEYTPDEILAKLEHYCAYQERSPKEVRQKLSELGADAEASELIYTILLGDNYLNEERFAMAFAGGKFRVKHWGRHKIRMALRKHGIGNALIEKALSEIDPDQYEATLRRLLEAKRAQVEGDPRARQKILNYMLQAGFEQDLVFSYL
ncbi:MAG: regulatory protein RecX [Saprospiraceae bacterium]